jgi:hypothetical protein
MEHAEWKKLDDKFQDMLLSAYHHYVLSLENEGDEFLKNTHLSLVDKYFKEAYNLRQSHINASLGV